MRHVRQRWWEVVSRPKTWKAITRLELLIFTTMGHSIILFTAYTIRLAYTQDVLRRAADSDTPDSRSEPFSATRRLGTRGV